MKLRDLLLETWSALTANKGRDFKGDSRKKKSFSPPRYIQPRSERAEKVVAQWR